MHRKTPKQVQSPARPRQRHKPFSVHTRVKLNYFRLINNSLDSYKTTIYDKA
jgi:hypothetical protein